MKRYTALALIVLSSCGGGGGGESAQLQEMKASRARWEALGLTNYEYTIRRSCFCPVENIGPFRVTVRNGVSTVTTRAAKTRHGGHSDPNHDISSVDVLFQTIESALSTNTAHTTVTYDPERGIPTSIAIDPIPTAVDDEFGYTLTEFAPLP